MKLYIEADWRYLQVCEQNAPWEPYFYTLFDWKRVKINQWLDASNPVVIEYTLSVS